MLLWRSITMLRRLFELRTPAARVESRPPICSAGGGEGPSLVSAAPTPPTGVNAPRAAIGVRPFHFPPWGDGDTPSPPPAAVEAAEVIAPPELKQERGGGGEREGERERE
jgi:hypothetical protein